MPVFDDLIHFTQSLNAVAWHALSVQLRVANFIKVPRTPEALCFNKRMAKVLNRLPLGILNQGSTDMILSVIGLWIPLTPKDEITGVYYGKCKALQ